MVIIYMVISGSDNIPLMSPFWTFLIIAAHKSARYVRINVIYLSIIPPFAYNTRTCYINTINYRKEYYHETA